MADQGLPVFWLPEMLTVRVTTFFAVCVITFERGSAKPGKFALTTSFSYALASCQKTALVACTQNQILCGSVPDRISLEHFTSRASWRCEGVIVFQ